MSLLLAVDPGLRASGVALYEGRTLAAAALVFPPHEEVLACAVAAMAAAVRDWAPPRTLSLVVEKPQTYGGRAAKGDANTLINLALVVGAVLASFNRDAWVRLAAPHEWKGSVPKRNDRGETVMELRARRILAPDEIARVDLPRQRTLRHNVWDAVMLGAWAVGR